MNATKSAMIDIITRQPDDSSYDEILRELMLSRMIQRGLSDADANRTIPDDEMKRTIESWRK